MCLAGAAICLETLDGPVDGKIVLPPSLPAWSVFMDCLSFFSMSMFLVVRLSSEDKICHSLTDGRESILRHTG